MSVDTANRFFLSDVIVAAVRGEIDGDEARDLLAAHRVFIDEMCDAEWEQIWVDAERDLMPGRANRQTRRALGTVWWGIVCEYQFSGDRPADLIDGLRIRRKDVECQSAVDVAAEYWRDESGQSAVDPMLRAFTLVDAPGAP
jgi:hypothetical protein